MYKKIFMLSLFVLFSLSIASNGSKNENLHENYKNQTLNEKNNEMKVLGLDKASSSKKSNAKPIKKGLMIKSQIDVARKAEFIGKEPMIPSNGSRDCEGLSEEDCEWLDFCVWTDLGCDDIDNEFEDECPFFDNPEECLVAGCEWDEDGCFRPDEDDDGEWEDECEGLSQDECTMMDFCMWNYEDNFCHFMDDESTDCDDGYLQDCSGDGDCCPESWIGDGFTDCEDQAWGCDLSCYDNDGGDCAGEGDDGGDDGNADDGGTGGSDCVDCVGNDCSGYEQWIGDGICDDGEYGIFYNCLEFECDAGDCGFDSNGECENNWEDDGGTGGDDGGASSCDEIGGNESWLGDGWCDTINNNEACGYDSGDCCYSTCVSTAHDCEADTGPCTADICIDPDGNNDDCEDSNDDGGESECSSYSQEDCMWFDYCMWTDAGCVDYDGGECENYDCMDQCYDGYENWLGDGYCDDGSWGIYFNCEEFDCDYGDCLNEAGECAGNTGDDGGNELSCSDISPEDCEYVDLDGDGALDCTLDPSGNCVDNDTGDDGGNEGCDDGFVDDCSGDGDCCPEGWIGDGFEDCEDQAYGCDLTCYDNDGGDCEYNGDGGDDGGWEPEAAVIIGYGSSVPGGEVQVPLFLESAVPVSGIQFTLNADPSDWQSVVDFSAMVSTGNCFEADFNNTPNGTIGLLYSLSGCEFNPSNESVQIGTLTFEISEDAEWGGAIELYFTNLIVASSGGEQVDAEGYGGLITIGSVGDVNHDGEINVIDAVAMIQFILQFEEPSESDFWASDLNEDGSLDILDIVLLIEIILGD